MKPTPLLLIVSSLLVSACGVDPSETLEPTGGDETASAQQELRRSIASDVCHDYSYLKAAADAECRRFYGWNFRATDLHFTYLCSGPRAKKINFTCHSVPV